MKIKVTKKMVSELNKAIDFAKFLYREFSTTQYTWYVDSQYYMHENDMDFDDEGNYKFKVIEVIYPSTYYANNVFLTTNDLRKYAKDCKTLNEFYNEIRKAVEI